MIVKLIIMESLTLQELETQYIKAVLEKHGGRKPAAAEELGISLKTLYNKVNAIETLAQWRRGYAPNEPTEVPFALRLAEAPLDAEEVACA